MSAEKAKQYAERIERVVNYIHDRLDEPLSLDRLAAVANFSKFHFHRQFTAYMGVPVHKLIQQLRLRRASRALAFGRRPITEIALEAGFENSESFSRAFRQLYGQSPSEFRAEPDWRSWREIVNRMPQPETKDMRVELVDFPYTKVALLEHRGSEHDVYRTTRRFIEWRRGAGVPPDRGETYGLHYHDAASVAPEDYRFDICVSYPGEVDPNSQGVVSSVIPAGRCARVRHRGSREYIPAAEWLYREWLPGSGEELRDFPFFFHYVNVGPDVGEKDMITDLYLPLE
ncbi:MAG TPA: AraC family transcriptional regulator [Gammaproteobacteria bacterium]|nr:AraC family transcriptional regulator [Gammaproteobacteria bacterium]